MKIPLRNLKLKKPKLKSLKCQVGLHNWRVWEHPNKRLKIVSKVCKRCGKRQRL